MLVSTCWYGHHNIVQLFLARGENTAAPALEVAAEHGYVDVVRLLLDHEAEHGKALSTAAAKGHLDIVEVLLNNGADVKAVERPLLAYAVEQEHGIMFQILLDHGCDITDSQTLKECTRAAEENGLDSMTTLIHQAWTSAVKRTQATPQTCYESGEEARV